jgi:hypothetical protein
VVDFLLLIHGSVLTAAVAELVHCLWTSEANVTRTHANEAIESLRFRLIEELRTLLRPVFRDTNVVRICDIVDERGDPWKTETGDPEKTEAFRNAFSSFINAERETVADYVTLRNSKERWLFWTRGIGYLVFAATAWQVIAFLGIGIPAKVWGTTPSDIWITISIVPTILFVVAYFVMAGMRMWLGNLVVKISGQYD